MKKLLLLLNILFWGVAAHPAILPGASAGQPDPVPSGALAHFATLKVKEVEKLAGRKLSLKEKIALKIVQWKIRKGWKFIPEKKNDRGKASLVLGIAGIVLLLTPFITFGWLASLLCSILALTNGYKARKANPDDRRAKTGILLGWIGIGLFIALLILVIVIIASWTGGWG